MGRQGPSEVRNGDATGAALRLLSEAACAAAPPSLGFAERVAAGLQAILAMLARDATLARLTLVEVRSMDSPHYRPYRRTLDRLAALLDKAAADAGLDPEPPASTARAVISGMVALASHEVDADRAARLPQLYPELLFCALAPYVGPHVAAEAMRRARRSGGDEAGCP